LEFHELYKGVNDERKWALGEMLEQQRQAAAFADYLL
jgi:hypothetical protein